MTWQHRRIMAIWLSHHSNSEQWGLGYRFKLFADFLELVQSSLFEFLDIIDFFLMKSDVQVKLGGPLHATRHVGSKHMSWWRVQCSMKRFVLPGTITMETRV